MMKKVGMAALAVGLMAAAAIPALAAEGDPETDLSVLVGVGVGDNKLLGDQHDSDIRPALGLRLGHTISERMGFFTDVVAVNYNGDGGPFGDVNEIAGRAGLDWFLFGERWKTYIATGLGLARFDPQTAGNALRPIASVGFGQRHPFGDNSVFGWEIRGDQTFWDSGLNGDNFLTMKALVGVGFGIGGPPKDTDGDGVPDKKDQCPDTPRGAVVDERGCPKDSDGDGVWDGIDQCPGTAAGTPVDERGCPKDGDGDGVHDGIDKCPDTPKGAHVDANGCPTDGDGDGVWDGLDRCPDTPKGCRVDAKGCTLDADGDGVCDGIDECPGTPRGTKVDEKGCEVKPVVAPLFQPEQRKLILEGVNFEVNQAILTADSTAILDKVAESLAAYPEVKVEVGGHTDSDGSDGYNLKLSQSRADAVKAYLVGKGIDPARLTTKGYGERNPIADNKTKDGKAKNRRVELTRID